MRPRLHYTALMPYRCRTPRSFILRWGGLALLLLLLGGYAEPFAWCAMPKWRIGARGYAGQMVLRFEMPGKGQA